MLTLILAVAVLIGLYFIYKQVSSLNTLLDKVILVLNNNKEFISENCENISDSISNEIKDHNQSIFDPEYLMSKFLNTGANTSNFENNEEQYNQINEEEEDRDDDETDFNADIMETRCFLYTDLTCTGRGQLKVER